MAGSGWNTATAGPGITVSADGGRASRPDAGGGGEFAGIRGRANKARSRRYFEIVAPDSTCSVGIVDLNADVGSLLGGGSSPSQWGFFLQTGYLHYREANTNGSDNSGTGLVAAGVVGVLVDFNTHFLTIFVDGVELLTRAISFDVDTFLYPAVSMGVGSSDVELITAEPFNFPPQSTYIAWDISDASVISKISGNVKIDGSPAARLLKAFSMERLTFFLGEDEITESKPVGQSVSDEVSGDYEILLRDGFPRQIFVVQFDEYGVAFEADTAVSLGDRIHPTVPNGYIYQCTGGGNLPSVEPDPWPTDTEASHLVGTASFNVKPFYRPEVHGPIVPLQEVLEETGHRYYRIYIYNNNGDGSYTGLSEVELRDEEGVDKTDNTPVTVTSSSAYPNYGPEKVIDNDTSGNSRWLTESGSAKPCWLAFEFDIPVDLRSLILTTNDGYKRGPRDFAFEFSDNGVEWVELARWPAESGWGYGVTKAYSW